MDTQANTGHDADPNVNRRPNTHVNPAIQRLFPHLSFEELLLVEGLLNASASAAAERATTAARDAAERVARAASEAHAAQMAAIRAGFADERRRLNELLAAATTRAETAERMFAEAQVAQRAMLAELERIRADASREKEALEAKLHEMQKKYKALAEALAEELRAERESAQYKFQDGAVSAGDEDSRHVQLGSTAFGACVGGVVGGVFAGGEGAVAGALIGGVLGFAIGYAVSCSDC